MEYRVITGPPFYRTRIGRTFFAILTPEQERRHIEAGRIVPVIRRTGKPVTPTAPRGASRSTQPQEGGQ